MALSETAHEIYTACQLVPGEGILDAVGRIETILAEVHKEDTELIRQLVEALEVLTQDYDDSAVGLEIEALAAGRARLQHLSEEKSKEQ